MNYEVIDKASGMSEVLSDTEIERRFGAVAFTEMVADIHSTHSAVSLDAGGGAEDLFMGIEGGDYTDDLIDWLN